MHRLALTRSSLALCPLAPSPYHRTSWIPVTVTQPATSHAIPAASVLSRCLAPTYEAAPPPLPQVSSARTGSRHPQQEPQELSMVSPDPTRGAFASATHRSPVCPLGSGRPSATVGVATRPRRQWAERSRSAPLHPLQCGSPPKRQARIRKKACRPTGTPTLAAKKVRLPLPEVSHLREGSTKARMSVS